MENWEKDNVKSTNLILGLPKTQEKESQGICTCGQKDSVNKTRVGNDQEKPRWKTLKC